MILLWVPDRVADQRVAPTDVLVLLTRFTSLSAFLVVFFITSGVFTIYAFLTPIIGSDFHGGASDITVAIAVLGVAGVLGNLLATLALRVSAERLLLVGIALLALDLLGLAVMPRQLGGLLLALVVWVLATDIVWPSQQQRIVDAVAIAGWLYPVFCYIDLLLASLMFLLLAFVSLRFSERCARVHLSVPELT